MSLYPDGVDFSTFWNQDGTSDLDPNFTPINGALSVLERFGRRMIARSGDYDNADVGVDVDSYTNAMLGDGDLQALSSRIKEQALQEEGIASIQIQNRQTNDGKVFLPCNIVMADKSEWEMVFSLTDDNLPRIALIAPTVL